MAALALHASAHEELERYIQQRVTAEVSSKNIDFTLEILFTSPASLKERKRIDANHDGALDKTEREAFVKTALADMESKLHLTVDGQKVNLVPLADTELDLLDSKDMEAHPHIVRFQFFARMPASFRAGSVLQLDSQLYVADPCLVAVSVQGKDGIQMSAAPTEGLKRPAKDEKSLCLLKATCRQFKASGDNP